MLTLGWGIVPGIPFLGLGAYGSAAFHCAGGICVGSYNDVTTVFRRLQNLANQAAQQLGIGGPIAVDGKIGPNTVARVYLVSTSMPYRPDLPLLSAMQSGMDPSMLAANAQDYVAELEALTSGEIQMPPEQVTQPHTSPVYVPPHTTTRPVQTPGVPGAGPHMTTSATSAITALPPLARGVLAVGLAAGLGAVLYKIRKNRKARAAAPGVAGWFGYRRR